MSWLEFVIALLNILTKASVLAVAVTIYLVICRKQSLVALGDWFQATVKTIRLPGGLEAEMRPSPQESKAPKEPTEMGTKEISVELWKRYWHFEWIWGAIYKSQIEILDELNTQESKSSTWYQLASHYDNAAKVNPALRSYHYGEYLKFLENNQLIKQEYNIANPLDDIISITDYGEQFLLYLKKAEHFKEGRIY